MKSDIQINAIRKRFAPEDNKVVRGYFSVYAIFEEGEKEIPITERDNDIEAFDKAIDYAKENEAIEIIIVLHSKKTEPRTKRNEYHIRINESDKPAVSEEKILNIIEDKMKSLEQNLSGLQDEPGGLGLIKQEYKHQSDVLRLETKQRFKEIEFERKIEALERKIDEKDETILESAKEIEELNSELEELQEAFEKYKADKFEGLSDQLRDAGNSILNGIVAKALPLLTGGTGMEGVATDAAGAGQQSNTTIVEEESNPAIDKILSEIRGVIVTFDDNQLQQFYQLMIYLATDPSSNISTLYELIKQ